MSVGPRETGRGRMQATRVAAFAAALAVLTACPWGSGGPSPTAELPWGGNTFIVLRILQKDSSGGTKPASGKVFYTIHQHDGATPIHDITDDFQGGWYVRGWILQEAIGGAASVLSGKYAEKLDPLDVTDCDGNWLTQKVGPLSFEDLPKDRAGLDSKLQSTFGISLADAETALGETLDGHLAGGSSARQIAFGTIVFDCETEREVELGTVEEYDGTPHPPKKDE